MPKARYCIRRFRLWNGEERDLGFELRWIESRSGVILPGPVQSGVHLTYCVKRSGHLNAHIKNEQTSEYTDLFDVCLPDAIQRLAGPDFEDECRERILGASYFVADPSQLESHGIFWLMPIPIASGAFDGCLIGEVADLTLLRPVPVLAAWQSPHGSAWAAYEAKGELFALLWSVRFAEGVGVLLIPWRKGLMVLWWLMQQFAGPDGLLPPEEEFLPQAGR